MRNRWLSILSPLLLLALWEAAAQLGWINRIFFPPPSEVFAALSRLTAGGQLANDVAISLWRVGAGFVLGALPAIALGLLMGISPTLRALAQPLAAALYPVPKIALLPLIIVALGIGEESKIAFIAVSVFFLMVLGVASSVLQVDAHYFDVARSFRAKPWDVFWTVALPASLPGTLTSLKLGLGYALTLIVGAEFVGAREGIGWRIWESYTIYALDRMLAALVVIALIGWVMTVLLDELEFALLPWQARSVQVHEARARRQVRIWWGAARPWSYPAAIVPIGLGTVIAAADGYFNFWLFALTLVGGVAMQAGANLVNDYFDYVQGADAKRALGNVGIGGAIQRGEMRPAQVLALGLGCFALAALIGLYLVSVSGPWLLWIGLFGLLIGFFYTAGPFALAYIGLGELAVFLAMGPLMVIGAYYVQTGAVTWPVLLASLPVGFLVSAILHANNLRDLDDDRAAGKRTLATLLGRAGANVEMYLLIAGAYVTALIAVLAGAAPAWTIIAAVTLPAAWKVARRVSAETEPRGLQAVLRQTAQLHLYFGVLLILGWLGAWAGAALR